jgi:NAD(P)-dependent dehydrogenase (short-subunit alcohol dehydrogenase family)
MLMLTPSQTLNIRGNFLVTQSFLAALPTPSTPAKIITLCSAPAYEIFPTFSAYGISKLAVFELMTYVAVENPNVVAVAVHPGIVRTDMMLDMFEPFAHDTPELVGGLAVWLASWEDSKAFLSGRYVSANWDVEGLVQRKGEILEGELLKMDINARLGLEQFER